MTALVIDNIGSLVTNDPALGEGPLGLIADASVVIEGDIRSSSSSLMSAKLSTSPFRTAVT